MDFSDYDRVDEQALNQILWHDIKGPDVPMLRPGSVRRRALPAIRRPTCAFSPINQWGGPPVRAGPPGPASSLGKNQRV